MSNISGVSGFVMVSEDGGVQTVSVGGGSDLLKSHVAGYTRKDGAYVKEHDDKRQKKVEPTVLPDDHDFHGQLGAMKDGEKAHFGNSVFKMEKFNVEKKGDRFHMGGPIANTFFKQPKDGYSHDEMTEQLKRLHTGPMNTTKERLMHYGNEGGAEGGEAKGDDEPKGSTGGVESGPATQAAQKKMTEGQPKAKAEGEKGEEKPAEGDKGGDMPDGVKKTVEALGGDNGNWQHGDGKSSHPVRFGGGRHTDSMDTMVDNGWQMLHDGEDSSVLKHPDGHTAVFSKQSNNLTIHH